MRRLVALLCLFLPWSLKRRLMKAMLGYDLDPTASIGFSFVAVDALRMEAYCSIGHLNVIKGLAELHLCDHASVGRGNWITGFPKVASRHFEHCKERHPSLIVGAHAAVTNRHIIDCTDRVTIGEFSTFAGFASQLLTHSIDIEEARQDARPVHVGKYCFVGTASILLPGSSLPDYCVLGAGSVLSGPQVLPYHLYGGVPAKPVKPLPKDAAYFLRLAGFIY